MGGRPAPRRLTAALLAAGVGCLALTGCGASPGAAAPAAVSAPVTPAPVAEVDARPAVLAASVPVRVQIPSIGVDSELMALGLQDDGTLEVPPTGFPAGWFTDAPTPGERGPAVLAGHVDWGGAPGVFADLHDVAVGDEVRVLREDGSTAVFAVTSVGRFAKDDFPTAAVYADLDSAGLRVITCGGDFDRAAHSYLDNTVVFADLVGSG